MFKLIIIAGLSLILDKAQSASYKYDYSESDEVLVCTWQNPICPSGYRCQFQWSEGPFKCVRTMELSMLRQTEILQMYGVANGCGPQEETAIANARQIATKYCKDEKGNIHMLEEEQPLIISSFRASCWTGNPSGAVARIRFQCLSFDDCQTVCTNRGKDFSQCHTACGGW